MPVTLKMLLICCPFAGLAGFLDAVAGGGGIISLPAYLIAGLPAHFAHGTNKFAASIGSVIACAQYQRSRVIRWDLAPVAIAGALVGSWCGAHLVLVASDRFLRLFMMIALPIIAVFLLTNRNFGVDGKEKQLTRRALWLRLAVIGLVVGAYDGFFGPGSGTFFVLGYTMLIGISLLNATATARVLNLASNLAALVTFLVSGNVLFGLAIPCAACSVLGSLIGSRMAVRIGAPVIRRVMTLVMILLLVKIAFDFFA